MADNHHAVRIRQVEAADALDEAADHLSRLSDGIVKGGGGVPP
jgi:hypothetical protein